MGHSTRQLTVGTSTATTSPANGGEYTAGAFLVAHTYAKCRGAAHFRPIAFNIKVKNRTYPTVTGNVNTITCK